MTQDLIASRVESMKIGTFLQRHIGKRITGKDVRNLNIVRGAEEFRFVEEFCDILNAHPDNEGRLLNNEEGIIDCIYVQTHIMKRNYQEFPELLIMDTTHAVNRTGMLLTTLMVVDGNGKGAVAAHALVKGETKVVMTKFLEQFIEFNSDYIDQTEVIIVDRSSAELGAIQALLPKLPIHLCAWHCMEAMKTRLGKEHGLSETKKEKVKKILKRMIYAYTEAGYVKALEALYDLKGIPSFQGYIDKQWDKCKYSWTQFERKEIPTFNIRTTNHLESFHRYLKKEVDATKSLQSCFKTICDFTEARNDKKTIDELMEEVSYTYNLNDDSPASKFIHERYTPGAVELMLEEKKLLKDKKKHKMECTEVKGHHHLVKENRNSYLVTLADDRYSCTCTFFRSQRLVCKHGFHCIEMHALPFKPCWVLSRWVKPHLKKLARENKNHPNLPEEKAPTDSDVKYSHTKNLANEFINVATNKDPATYMLMMEQLRIITVGHTEGIEVSVRFMSDEPIDMDLGRDTTKKAGLSKENKNKETKSTCKNDTGVKDRTRGSKYESRKEGNYTDTEVERDNRVHTEVYDDLIEEDSVGGTKEEDDDKIGEVDKEDIEHDTYEEEEANGDNDDDEEEEEEMEEEMEETVDEDSDDDMGEAADEDNDDDDHKGEAVDENGDDNEENQGEVEGDDDEGNKDRGKHDEEDDEELKYEGDEEERGEEESNDSDGHSDHEKYDWNKQNKREYVFNNYNDATFDEENDEVKPDDDETYDSRDDVENAADMTADKNAESNVDCSGDDEPVLRGERNDTYRNMVKKSQKENVMLGRQAKIKGECKQSAQLSIDIDDGDECDSEDDSLYLPNEAELLESTDVDSNISTYDSIHSDSCDESDDETPAERIGKGYSRDGVRWHYPKEKEHKGMGRFAAFHKRRRRVSQERSENNVDEKEETIWTTSNSKQKTVEMKHAVKETKLNDRGKNDRQPSSQTDDKEGATPPSRRQVVGLTTDDKDSEQVTPETEDEFPDGSLYLLTSSGESDNHSGTEPKVTPNVGVALKQIKGLLVTTAACDSVGGAGTSTMSDKSFQIATKEVIGPMDRYILRKETLAKKIEIETETNGNHGNIRNTQGELSSCNLDATGVGPFSTQSGKTPITEHLRRFGKVDRSKPSLQSNKSKITENRNGDNLVNLVGNENEIEQVLVSREDILKDQVYLNQCNESAEGGSNHVVKRMITERSVASDFTRHIEVCQKTSAANFNRQTKEKEKATTTMDMKEKEHLRQATSYVHDEPLGTVGKLMRWQNSDLDDTERKMEKENIELRQDSAESGTNLEKKKRITKDSHYETNIQFATHSGELAGSIKMRAFGKVLHSQTSEKQDICVQDEERKGEGSENVHMMEDCVSNTLEAKSNGEIDKLRNGQSSALNVNAVVEEKKSYDTGGKENNGEQVSQYKSKIEGKYLGRLGKVLNSQFSHKRRKCDLKEVEMVEKSGIGKRTVGMTNQSDNRDKSENVNWNVSESRRHPFTITEIPPFGKIGQVLKTTKSAITINPVTGEQTNSQDNRYERKENVATQSKSKKDEPCFGRIGEVSERQLSFEKEGCGLTGKEEVEQVETCNKTLSMNNSMSNLPGVLKEENKAAEGTNSQEGVQVRLCEDARKWPKRFKDENAHTCLDNRERQMNSTSMKEREEIKSGTNTRCLGRIDNVLEHHKVARGDSCPEGKEQNKGRDNGHKGPLDSSKSDSTSKTRYLGKIGKALKWQSANKGGEAQEERKSESIPRRLSNPQLKSDTEPQFLGKQRKGNVIGKQHSAGEDKEMTQVSRPSMNIEPMCLEDIVIVHEKQFPSDSGTTTGLKYKDNLPAEQYGTKTGQGQSYMCLGRIGKVLRRQWSINGDKNNIEERGSQTKESSDAKDSSSEDYECLGRLGKIRMRHMSDKKNENREAERKSKMPTKSKSEVNFQQQEEQCADKEKVTALREGCIQVELDVSNDHKVETTDNIPSNKESVTKHWTLPNQDKGADIGTSHSAERDRSSLSKKKVLSKSYTMTKTLQSDQPLDVNNSGLQSKKNNMIRQISFSVAASAMKEPSKPSKGKTLGRIGRVLQGLGSNNLGQTGVAECTSETNESVEELSKGRDMSKGDIKTDSTDNKNRTNDGRDLSVGTADRQTSFVRSKEKSMPGGRRRIQSEMEAEEQRYNTINHSERAKRRVKQVDREIDASSLSTGIQIRANQNETTMANQNASDGKTQGGSGINDGKSACSEGRFAMYRKKINRKRRKPGIDCKVPDIMHLSLPLEDSNECERRGLEQLDPAGIKMTTKPKEGLTFTNESAINTSRPCNVKDNKSIRRVMQEEEGAQLTHWIAKETTTTGKDLQIIKESKDQNKMCTEPLSIYKGQKNNQSKTIGQQGLNIKAERGRHPIMDVRSKVDYSEIKPVLTENRQVQKAAPSGYGTTGTTLPSKVQMSTQKGNPKEGAKIDGSDGCALPNVRVPAKTLKPVSRGKTIYQLSTRRSTNNDKKENIIGSVQQFATHPDRRGSVLSISLSDDSEGEEYGTKEGVPVTDSTSIGTFKFSEKMDDSKYGGQAAGHNYKLVTKGERKMAAKIGTVVWPNECEESGSKIDSFIEKLKTTRKTNIPASFRETGAVTSRSGTIEFNMKLNERDDEHLLGKGQGPLTSTPNAKSFPPHNMAHDMPKGSDSIEVRRRKLVILDHKGKPMKTDVKIKLPKVINKNPPNKKKKKKKKSHPAHSGDDGSDISSYHTSEEEVSPKKKRKVTVNRQTKKGKRIKNRIDTENEESCEGERRQKAKAGKAATNNSKEKQGNKSIVETDEEGTDLQPPRRITRQQTNKLASNTSPEKRKMMPKVVKLNDTDEENQSERMVSNKGKRRKLRKGHSKAKSTESEKTDKLEEDEYEEDKSIVQFITDIPHSDLLDIAQFANQMESVDPPGIKQWDVFNTDPLWALKNKVLKGHKKKLNDAFKTVKELLLTELSVIEDSKEMLKTIDISATILTYAFTHKLTMWDAKRGASPVPHDPNWKKAELQFPQVDLTDKRTYHLANNTFVMKDYKRLMSPTSWLDDSVSVPCISFMISLVKYHCI